MFTVRGPCIHVWSAPGLTYPYAALRFLKTAFELSRKSYIYVNSPLNFEAET